MHHMFKEYSRNQTTINDWPNGLQSVEDISLFNAVITDLEEMDRIKAAIPLEQQTQNVTINITFQ